MIKKNNYLSVVVLFWNDSEKTIQCLNSIFKQKKIKFTLFLVDNNSEKKYSNNILKWINQKKIKYKRYNKSLNFDKMIPSIKCIYIKNKFNYGCGLGHNPGYKLSIDYNFRFIARIDNDMILPNDLLYKLTSRLEKNKKIIGLSPKVMFMKKPNLIWFRGAKVGNNLKLQKQCSDFIPGEKDSKKIRGLVKTDSLVGCASIMRGKNLKLAGLSDPDFFYGEEDIELSYRLKKTSGILAVDLDQKIFHEVSHTVGKNWAKNIYYNYKYRLVLIKKIGSFWDKILGYSIFVLKFFIFIILSYKKKYSSRLVPIYLAGIHFIKKKYGNYDRKNYKKIDSYFQRYNKKTSFYKIIENLNDKRTI